MTYRGPLFIAERVFDKGNFNGKIFYLVKWKSYFETWEPADTLGCPELVQEYENLIRKKNLPESGINLESAEADIFEVSNESEEEEGEEEEEVIEIPIDFNQDANSSQSFENQEAPVEITVVPDPEINSDFKLDTMPEKILMTHRKSPTGELHFLVKWKNDSRIMCIPACLVCEKWPKLIVEFYRDKQQKHVIVKKTTEPGCV